MVANIVAAVTARGTFDGERMESNQEQRDVASSLGNRLSRSRVYHTYARPVRDHSRYMILNSPSPSPSPPPSYPPSSSFSNSALITVGNYRPHVTGIMIIPPILTPISDLYTDLVRDTKERLDIHTLLSCILIHCYSSPRFTGYRNSRMSFSSWDQSTSPTWCFRGIITRDELGVRSAHSPRPQFTWASPAYQIYFKCSTRVVLRFILLQSLSRTWHDGTAGKGIDETWKFVSCLPLLYTGIDCTFSFARWKLRGVLMRLKNRSSRRTCVSKNWGGPLFAGYTDEAVLCDYNDIWSIGRGLFSLRFRFSRL